MVVLVIVVGFKTNCAISAVDLHLPVQSVPITTKVEKLNLAHSEVY